jgi:hypothetical protein
MRPPGELAVVVFNGRLLMVLWIGKVIFLFPTGATTLLFDDTMVASTLSLPEQRDDGGPKRLSIGYV